MIVYAKLTDERRAASPNDRVMLKPAKPNDVGYDLPLWLPRQDVAIEPGEWKDLPTGYRLCLPPEIGARIVSRSSTLFRLKLRVYEGLIDPGYTGELRVMVENPTKERIIVQDGQRLAQVVFIPVIRPTIFEVEDFPATDRGDSGFGSTGL